MRGRLSGMPKPSPQETISGPININNLVDYKLKLDLDFGKLSNLLQNVVKGQEENKKDLESLTQSFIQFKAENDLFSHIENSNLKFSQLNVYIYIYILMLLDDSEQSSK